MSANSTAASLAGHQLHMALPETLKTFDKWALVRTNGDALPSGIVLDPEIANALDSVHDEVMEQYEGRFTEDFVSDLGILLVLAKRSLRDSRFLDMKNSIGTLIQEVAEVIEETLIVPSIHKASLDTNERVESLRDNWITMQLALRLDEEVTIVPGPGDGAVKATLNSFPRSASKQHVRLWFSLGSELLSMRLLWTDLPRLVKSEVWDLSSIN